MEYRSCPSCGTACFFSALNGDKIVFYVKDSGEWITDPDQTFDEILLDINPWKIYCSSCAWSGPIHDLILEYA